MFNNNSKLEKQMELLIVVVQDIHETLKRQEKREEPNKELNLQKAELEEEFNLRLEKAEKEFKKEIDKYIANEEVLNNKLEQEKETKIKLYKELNAVYKEHKKESLRCTAAINVAYHTDEKFRQLANNVGRQLTAEELKGVYGQIDEQAEVEKNKMLERERIFEILLEIPFEGNAIKLTGSGLNFESFQFFSDLAGGDGLGFVKAGSWTFLIRDQNLDSIACGNSVCFAINK